MASSSIKQRNSSIEALKIFGILLIVISHVVQTLGGNGNPYIPFEGYGINMSAATTDLKQLLIVMLSYSGHFGNTIFFVCSAWFLLDSSSARKQKILLMLADIWTVSIVILAVVLILRRGQLNESLVFISLLPTTFENNWYLNCYLLFFAIHPILNRIIYGFSQRVLFRATLCMSILYFIISFITRLTAHMFGAGTTFFSSSLIIWIVIYFVIAYCKLFAKEATENKALNIILVIVGIIGYYGLIVITNIVELKTGLLSDSLQLWYLSYNPFLIVLVIGLFNLAKGVHFYNKGINYISKLSLYIYIIHENRLLRTLYRPAMWNYIYEHYGYSHVLGWVFILVVIVLAFGLIGSIIYYETLHNLVLRICENIYPNLLHTWRSIENKLLKIQ